MVSCLMAVRIWRYNTNLCFRRSGERPRPCGLTLARFPLLPPSLVEAGEGDEAGEAPSTFVTKRGKDVSGLLSMSTPIVNR